VLSTTAHTHPPLLRASIVHRLPWCGSRTRTDDQARGAVISALSHTTAATPVPAALALGMSLPHPRAISPYDKLDPYHVDHASSGIRAIDVPFGMKPKEAGGMFDIWCRKGWANHAADEVFLAALTASMGNPREMGRGLRMDMKAVPSSPIQEAAAMAASGR
jgi:hypothetical protein